jgi:predicted small metal-binding protein
MARQITCEYGQIVRGENEDEVVDLALEHLRSDHPQLADRITRDEIVALIEVVESHPVRLHTPGREPEEPSWRASPTSTAAPPRSTSHRKRRVTPGPRSFRVRRGDLPDPERWSVADPGRVRPSQILSNAVSVTGVASCKAS